VHDTDGDIWGNGFIPRVNTRSRAGVMQALGAGDLFTDAEPLVHTVIVDARLANEDGDLQRAFRERNVSMIIDTQAWRYSDFRTWKSRWGELPSAPSLAFAPTEKWVKEYVLNDLHAQVEMGGSCALLPGWFPSLDDSGLARDMARWTLDVFDKFRRKGFLMPAIAWLPATTRTSEASIAMAEIYQQYEPIKALYVQFNRANGFDVPLDRLRRSVGIMLDIQRRALPVIAGHWGPVGLALRAVGITAADCGPCDSQSFEFSRAINDALPRDTSGPGVIRAQPIRRWVSELGQSVTKRQMEAIERDRAALAEVLCLRPCHRFRLGPDTIAIAAWHGILCLSEEASSQSRLPMRIKIDAARRSLRAVRSRIPMIDAVLRRHHEKGLHQDHLDVQLSLLEEAWRQCGLAY
jgi:hypothetical protein